LEVRGWLTVLRHSGLDKNAQTGSSREAERSRVGHPASEATKDGSGLGIFMARTSNSGH